METTSIFNNFEETKKPFYRNIFYKCEEFILTSIKHFCILIGQRKTGKTFCLKQLEDKYMNAKYFNFKNIDNENEQENIIQMICEDNTDTIYLLDEITYLKHYDTKMFILAEVFTYNKRNSKIKIIITGSQHLAIDYFASLAFATDANYIKTNFLTFPEWLRYKEIKEESIVENNYKDYLLNSCEFSKIEDNYMYLKYCIDETITSTYNSARIIYPQDCVEGIELDEIFTVAYCALLSLHDSENYDTFIKFEDKLEKVKHFFNSLNTDNKISTEEFNNAVNNTIIAQLKKIKYMTIFKFRIILRVLLKADLIVITHLGTSPDNLIKDWLKRDNPSPIETCTDFFKLYNITFKYPLFYINIIKDLVKNLNGVTLEDLITPPLLGSIVKCHIRGLLADIDNTSKVYGNNFGEEYKDFNNYYSEVDYINYFNNTLLEISIKDKKLKDLHFNDVSNNEEYKKIVTSKTKEDDMFIPYYKYIYKLS